MPASMCEDQGVDGHASIVTTMRYMHAIDQGKPGAITVLSEYRLQHRRKIVTNETPQILQTVASC
jgi:hypothetical protein